MRQRYAFDFGPRASKEKESVVVYRSRNIFYGEQEPCYRDMILLEYR